MAINDMTIIGRSLKSRLFSTTTTVLMVAVSVAMMLVLLTMRDAGYKAFERGSGNMHLLVSRDASPLVSVLNGVFYANPPRNPIEWAKYEEIANKFPLEYAIPIQQGDSYSGFPVLSTMPEFWTAYSPHQQPGMTWTWAEGRGFTQAYEVVLGAEVARATGLQLGQEIFITHGIGSSDTDRIVPPAKDSHDHGHDHHNHGHDDHGHDDHDHAHDDHDHGHDDHDHAHDDHDHGHDDHDHAHDDHDHGHDDHDHAHDDHDHGHGHGHGHGHHHHDGEHVHDEFPCKIVGILETTGGPHDRAVFTHLDTIWVMHAHDRQLAEDPRAGIATLDDLIEEDRLITGIYLRVLGREGSVLSVGMQPVFDALRRDTSITVAEPGNQVGALFRIISNIDDIFLGMAAVVLVSSAFAIMLALYNSMASRRRQIAVLRVLGSSRPKIFGLVVTESAIIGLLGAAAGIILALIGGGLVAAIMKSRLGLVISPELDPTITLTVAVGTVLLAALAGILPAIVAYRTSVARHLKPIA
ncbi:MAG: ABC transporter permease [Planctomycetota bacterium]